MWCRSFSTDVNHYDEGKKSSDDGLSLLLLKRLSDAEHDGDRIYCVVRDVLSGSDGNEDQINFVVSSASGQGRLLANIYLRNNFDTRKLLFVEVHGTGTPVGDPIEANCLGRFFNRSNLDPLLLLGSIKSNLGHSKGAAGVASLIKAAMYEQKYNLDIVQNFLPFLSLPNNEKIAIGFNSFGMGGTTTHAIMKEYQPNKTSIENDHIDDANHIKSKQYFIFSNKTISYQHSAIFVFLNRQQLQEQINAFLTEQASPGLSIISRPTKPLAQKICFVFSGQGPQWWAMGRHLYENEPLFNKWINLIDGEMTEINKGEWKLLEELIEKKTEQESRINDTNIAQTILFAIQVALSAFAGDQTAAFVAGCLNLEEAVRMLAVSMSEEEVENKILKDIEHLACIAVVNSPRRVTISACVRIENAFHSYQMNRFDIEKEMLSSLKDIRRLPVQDQKQIFDPICAQAKPYSSVIGE
ncbi:unnamed protein product [Adineta steineri]|uniref:Ketosynthase family 3 (KS3) domain-containing protein n=1 Tax=Adineta steineri TaxID=433720 RepID=A0A819SSX6_9BILA|nr:unnamed protein product [Adineta steineri]